MGPMHSATPTHRSHFLGGTAVFFVRAPLKLMHLRGPSGTSPLSGCGMSVPHPSLAIGDVSSCLNNHQVHQVPFVQTSICAKREYVPGHQADLSIRTAGQHGPRKSYPAISTRIYHAVPSVSCALNDMTPVTDSLHCFPFSR